MTDPGHVPVMLDEVVALLSPCPGDVVLDCTLGRGGHAMALAAAAPDVSVIGLDLDPDNLAFASGGLRAAGIETTTFHENFVRAPELIAQLGRPVDVVLADLGFASNQMDDPARGLSFRHDAPLDMRLDPTAPVTAASWLACAPQEEIAAAIGEYGEDPLATRIARNIAQRRAQGPIQTTGQLADIVREAYGARARTSRHDPATRTFQAIRIVVNDELAALQTLLDRVAQSAGSGDRTWLRSGARVGIIAFHSLEDRPVKRCFAGLVQSGFASDLSGGAVRACDAEQERNPRSRSARLRAIRMTTR